MKYVLTFVFLFFASLSFAQKELFLTTSAGWKVSYNQVETDKPLPRGLQFSRWSGFSSALGFEYKFSPHWSAHALVKTASMEMGVTERASARFDAEYPHRPRFPFCPETPFIAHVAAQPGPEIHLEIQVRVCPFGYNYAQRNYHREL